MCSTCHNLQFVAPASETYDSNSGQIRDRQETVPINQVTRFPEQQPNKKMALDKEYGKSVLAYQPVGPTREYWHVRSGTAALRIVAEMRKAQADSPAKEKLLEQAQELMLAKGFAATTVDEICQAAGLTKGSFFHYFRSKENLAKEVLDRFCQSQMERLGRSSLLKRSDPLERLYGWVDAVIEVSKSPTARKGCLLGNFAQELSDTHPKLRSQCAQRFSEWSNQLKKELDEARAKHLPGTRLDTQGLAEHLIAVLEGSLILAKAKQDMRVVEKNLLHFKRYLKALFGG